MAVQNLQLNVKADTSQAIRQVKALASAIGALGSGGEGLSKAIEKMASSAEKGFSASAPAKLTKGVENTTESVTKLLSVLKAVASAKEAAMGATGGEIVSQISPAPTAQANNAKAVAEGAAKAYYDEAQRVSEATRNINFDAVLGVNRAYKDAALSASVFTSRTEAVKRTLREVGSSFMVAAKSSVGFGSSLSHLFNQFKRIATYRLFKTVLKGITDSFRVGVQNLVQYSAALNGLDAAAANPTMS